MNKENEFLPKDFEFEGLIKKARKRSIIKMVLISFVISLVVLFGLYFIGNRVMTIKMEKETNLDSTWNRVMGANIEDRGTLFNYSLTSATAKTSLVKVVADGRYDYIETGSLISIKKSTASITIPSEEDRISMFPMDYEEFRWALGDTATIPLLRTFWDKRLALDAAHRSAQRDLRLYMLVGGMPQAVNAYLDTNNFQEVDEVKRKILQLYEDDFLKIDPSGKICNLFLQRYFFCNLL